jgi:HK97 family phage major capsid protein
MADATNHVEQARTSKLAELRSQMEEVKARIAILADKEVLTEDEERDWDELNVELDSVKPEHDKLEKRAARMEEIRQQTYRDIKGVPEFQRERDEVYNVAVNRLEDRAARDGAMRVLDTIESRLGTHQIDHLERTVQNETRIARRVLVTETDSYRSAFVKLMKDPNAHLYLTAEERDAMARYGVYHQTYEAPFDASISRAQSLTSGSGGYAVPVQLDPSLILTDQENDNPFLRICRVVNATSNVWKGVSSAGMSWSFDAESATVSDDSLGSIAQPTVNILTARGFIPFTIEIEQDWSGFAAEMAGLLASGYDELLLSSFTTGAGSTTAPDGIITACDASTGVEVASTTDGSFGQEDIYAVWDALPAKYQRNASWMMSVDVNSRIRQMGTALGHAYTVNLTQNGFPLFERPVYINPYFPSYTGTTGAENRLVVGDFQNYVIARRSGMQVELVPHLVDVTSNRPTGQRGWFAWARIGGDTANLAGFRLLQNQ